MMALRLVGLVLPLLLLQSSPGQTQSGFAIRVWVSGVGDDANPCNRTAPCMTFAGAISKVAPGGEISVLDSGDFGNAPLTITRSVSIINETGEAAVSAPPNGDAITINAGPNDVVVLRGLVIDGNLGQGTNGIVFRSGASLIVDKSVIKNFTAAAPNGFGINFVPTGAAELSVSDTVIINNGLASAGSGSAINVQPSINANVTLTRVQLENNSNGLLLASAGAAALNTINAAIHDSTIVGNQTNGIFSGGNSPVNVLVSKSVVAQNATAITTRQNDTRLRIGSSVVTGNANVLNMSATSTVASYKDNMIDGNANNNLPTAPPVPLN